ncbi:DUF3619 family protein [Imbroritus primus]|uniref:DUF3619 family protein n=1 Tax=Imbroritus primus TaxID=3058603 RepID=UPI003D161FD9
MNTQELKELRFADRVRAALNASANAVEPDIAARLAASRRMAVSRKKADAPQIAPVLVHAQAGQRSWGNEGHPSFGNFMRRFGLIGILCAIALSIAGVYEFQQEQRIDELADVDSAMLLDDLPPAAYADHGFHLFLKRAE